MVGWTLAFAAIGALESCILKATGVEYDFSEVKLSNLADEYLVTDGNRDGRGSILMSMGMIMLPPVQISMPFKLILFVLVDGWGLLTQQLFNSIL